MFVLKRDNTTEEFNLLKIENVLTLAFINSNTECNNIKEIVDNIFSDISNKTKDNDSCNIDIIQDIVECNLMKYGYYDTAKHYINYRKDRDAKRKEEGYINKISDNVETPWGMLGYITYKRTYARLLKDKEDETEEFRDTILRILGASQKQLNVNFTNEELKKAYYYLKSLKCSVAGRFLWQLGTETVDKLGTMSLQNCAFVVIDEPIKPFLWIFDVLMLGTGVGFNIQRKYVDKIPALIDADIKVTRVDTKDADFIIPDSREGWVSLLEKFLEAYYFKGKSFTYSTMLIRSAGTKIKGFGGTASGPEDLVKGLDNIQTILRKKRGEKLEPIDCLDIINIIATIVVAGNVRRCLPENSLVHTYNGLRKIKHIVVGDYVLTSSGYERVNNVFKQGKQNVMTLYTQDGIFKCTPNHRIAVVKNTKEHIWKMARDIEEDDIIMTPRVPIDGAYTVLPYEDDIDDIVKPELDADIAWFIGYLKYKKYYAVNKDNFTFTYKFDCTSEYNAFLKVEECFKRFGFVKNSKNSIEIYRVDDNNVVQYFVSVACSNINIFEYFAKFKQIKNIPSYIRESKYDIKLAYIAGLIDSNEYYDKCYISSCDSQDFTYDLQTLCYSCGFETRYMQVNSNHILIAVTEHARLIINSIKELKRPFKINILEKINVNSFDKYMLINDNLVNSFPELFAILNLNEGETIDIDTYNKYFGNINYCPTRVVSKEFNYCNEVCETYDIEVANKHEFYCNGVLTHNSALISLGDCNDIGYIKAKDWSTGNIPNWRCMSNNSVVCDDITKLPEEFWDGYKGNGEPYGLINIELSKKIGRIKDGGKYPDPDVEGYNPCLTGDTMIAVADDRVRVSIKQLAQEGRDVKVYSVNKHGDVEIKYGRNPRVTGKNRQIIKISFDDGTFIKTTLNHKFILSDNTVIEAKDLRENMVLLQFSMFDLYTNNSNKTRAYKNSIIKTFNGDGFKSYNKAVLMNVITVKAENKYVFNGADVIKDCEACKTKFAVNYNRREVSHCSAECDSIAKARNVRICQGGGKRQKCEYQDELRRLCEKHYITVPNIFDADDDSMKVYNSHKEALYNRVNYIKKVEILEEVEDVYNITVDDNHTVGVFLSSNNNKGIFVLNCGEQSLNNYETCCLSEIYLSNVTSYEELKEISKIVYRICKHSLLLKCHHEDTDNILHKNLRMGIGITGYMQASEEQKSWLDPLYEFIREYDVEYSKKNNIPTSIKLTTVKPSGTLSLLAGVTSGCHPAIYQYFIRRIRIASNNNLIKLCKSKGYFVEYQRHFDGSDDKNTMIVEFPCCYPEGSKLAKDMSAIEQLETVKYLQNIWSDNSVSCTIYYKLEELEDVKKWLVENYRENVKSCSFLLHNEHGFQQAPFEEITKEKYLEMMKNVVPITNGNINIEESPDYSGECANGVCPIR
jgi:ribonucleotide reductase alpha subunit